MEEYITHYLKYVVLTDDMYVHKRMRRFFAYMREHGVKTLPEVTAELIMQWLSDMRARNLSEGTVYAYLSTVRHFFAVLCHEKYLDVNPWPDYLKTKRPANRPRILPTPQKALELLEAAEKAGQPQRMRAILEIAYGCGLRRMELRNLNVSDIVGDTLRIRGKGGKERLVPLGKTGREYLERYLYGERLQIVRKYNPLEEALFVTIQGRRPTIHSYGAQMRRLPMKERFQLHSLRHACATHMLQNGASIALLQKLLGHDNIKTTEVYTRVDCSDLKRVMDKFHPRA
jgi:site-specific recombinase XerD